MIYELRIYHMYPGKMQDIHKRFSEETLGLFKKYNMTVKDFWEDLTENKIYYVMEYTDLDSRNQSFDAFASDPEWLEVKRLSELNGPIVQKIENYFMKRVPYSPAEQQQNG